MRLRTLVLREIFERKSQLFTSFLAILLGITVIVSIKNITYYSEGAVAQEMDSLGANVLVLPKSATLQDYYNADMQSETIPEEYVTQLAMSDLAGLDNISPKLSVPVQLQGKNFTLTGILPKNEFQAKAAWSGAGIFSRPVGCGASVGMMGSDDKKTLSRKKVIETLEDNEVLVGADVAAKLGLKDADSLELLGKKFTVTAVLPQTGTVDDSRIFAHLHTVQDLARKGPVVNAIEIIGCCQEISAGLVDKLNRLLPDAKVVTVAQIVQSQIKNQSDDVEPVAHVPGDYCFRGRSEHRQLHVRECLRAAAGNRHADGAGGRLAAGLESVSAESPVAWGRGRSRRLRARLDFRLRARPAVGRHSGVADVGVGDCGHCHFRRPHAGCEFLPRPACSPARSLCHIPGGLIHVEDGKRQQSL